MRAATLVLTCCALSAYGRRDATQSSFFSEQEDAHGDAADDSSHASAQLSQAHAAGQLTAIPLRSLATLLLFVGRTAAFAPAPTHSPVALRPRHASGLVRGGHPTASILGNLLKRKQTKAAAASKLQIALLKTEEDYKDKIQEASDEGKLIIIKYFAGYCKACKAIAPKIQRIARDFPEVEFYEIKYEENSQLFKRAGVKVLPYVDFYKGARGKVHGQACGPTKIEGIRRWLEADQGNGEGVLPGSPSS